MSLSKFGGDCIHCFIRLLGHKGFQESDEKSATTVEKPVREPTIPTTPSDYTLLSTSAFCRHVALSPGSADRHAHAEPDGSDQRADADADERADEHAHAASDLGVLFFAALRTQQRRDVSGKNSDFDKKNRTYC